MERRKRCNWCRKLSVVKFIFDDGKPEKFACKSHIVRISRLAVRLKFSGDIAFWSNRVDVPKL
jgi:hypothetical protein